jgi:hypothetical protein
MRFLRRFGLLVTILMLLGQISTKPQTKSLKTANLRIKWLSALDEVLFEGMILQIIAVENLFEYTQKGLKMIGSEELASEPSF